MVSYQDEKSDVSQGGGQTGHCRNNRPARSHLPRRVLATHCPSHQEHKRAECQEHTGEPDVEPDREEVTEMHYPRLPPVTRIRTNPAPRNQCLGRSGGREPESGENEEQPDGGEGRDRRMPDAPDK